MGISSQELVAVRNGCTKFLHGHGRMRPAQYFSELVRNDLSDLPSDHYGEGEFLQNFESEIADILGHNAGLFLQSGTMAQLIAARIITDEKKHSHIGFHPTCHLEIHEEKAYEKLHGLESILIGDKSKLISLEDLQNIETFPAFFIIELPQREIGGQLPAWDHLQAQVRFLQSHGVHVHLDGARIWECAPYYQKTYAEIASLFDSAYVSFYKGIGAVAGAALVGPEKLIAQAKVWNRRHGGNLVTAFPLYLSAKMNLAKRINMFYTYYEKTLEIADLISEIDRLSLRPERPQVNMFHLLVRGKKEDLIQRAVTIAKKKNVWGLAHLTSTEDTSIQKLEWYVGDGVLGIPLIDIKAMLIDWVGT